MRFLYSRIPPLYRLVIFLTLLFLCFLASIAYGTKQIPFRTVYSSFVSFNGSEEHVIIQTVRLPRAVIALAVGACLGVSGAIMQTLTRNPLASPELLGINHGAALGVVCSLFWVQSASSVSHIWFAFLGALLVVALVYCFGSMGSTGMTPMKLTVTGACLSTLLVSITQAILLLSERSFDEMRFWLAGSVSGRDIGLFADVLPFMIAALTIAIILSKKLEVLHLGDDVAKGLGQKTALVKAFSLLVIILAAGSAVSIAGPISFIGVAVPHLAKSIAGTDTRLIFLYSAILGSILLLLADTGARFVLYPQDVHVGIMTAILGAPFFIYMARKKVWKL